MIQLTEHISENTRRARWEIAAAEHIPYAYHYNDETLLTKDGELLQILRLEGFSFESVSPRELDWRKNLLNVLFKSIASDQYALWFHTIRTRQPSFPAGDFPSGFAADLNALWKKRNQSRRLFENTLTISIVRRRPGGGKVLGFCKLLDALSYRVDQTERGAHFQKACQELTEARRRFEAALASYGPQVLTIRPAPIGRVSEPLAFLSRLLNFEERRVRVAQMDIARYLPTKRLFFGPRAMECRGATSSRYAAILSIKEYGAETAAGMLDAFFQLPHELVITQSFHFSHRQEALGKMQKQQRLLAKSEDLALSQVAEITQALDEATSGAIAFGTHHLTVMPIANSMEELNEAIAAVESKLIDLGIMAVREDLNLEPCFWAQLPANSEHIARRAVISTANLAGFVSGHNFPSGQIAGNHWGPAVTILETQSGTPYFFNFHVGDVGHTSVIGPTGAGKTVLVNFLCAQAQKFRGRLFFFDKDRGAEIFLRALGGAYTILGASHPSGFNPLQLPDIPENRAFLLDWLKSLITAFGDPLTSSELAVLSEAVGGAYKLAMTDRTLARVAPFLGISGPGTLAGRLALWHSGGAYENLFGNEHDILSMAGGVHGFEMSALLQNRQILSPALLYLFHRIHQVLDGTPTIIVLDEAWALLDNPLFAPRIKDWLKTFRKRNALVVFATQSVEDAARSSISDTLLQQSATQIFLPNPKATKAYQSAFKLSERECAIVRDLDPASHSFLIKHGRETIIGRLDLSDLPQIVSVLSGRTETVARLDQLRVQVGDDPSAWLPTFQGMFL